jgi:hypothetical protein
MSDASWRPQFTIDLDTCSALAFQELIENFNKWAKANPPTIEWHTGWCDVGPREAEDLLKRNKHNRKVSLETVRRYGRDMAAGEWRRTGQPGLIDENGEVFDIQHRAWASYLSGYGFPTYIITDIPVMPDMFAYLDGGKPRSAADALYTAGCNGLSTAIAAAIKLAHRYEHGGFGIIKQPKITALTSPEVLTYSRSHPTLADAAHVMAGTYNKAMRVIGNRGVAVFAGWKISENFGSKELEQFMVPLGSGANLVEDDPILALRNRLLSFQEGDEDLNSARRIALIIKAFKLHRQGRAAPRGGLHLRDNERFPSFEEPQLPVPDAAQ